MSAARKVYEQAGVITVSKSTLTVEETAELLGISRGLAFQAVARGDIPSIRIGRRILVPVARLRALLQGAAAEAHAARPHVEDR